MSSPMRLEKRVLETSDGGMSDIDRTDHSAKRLRSDSNSVSEVEPEHLIIHQVECTQTPDHRHHSSVAYFLDPPRLFAEDNKASALRGNTPIYDIEEYLENQENISIVVYRSYDCERYHKHLTNKGAFERIKLSSSGIRGVPALQPYLSALKKDAAPASCKSEKMEIHASELEDALESLKKLNSKMSIKDFWEPEAPYLHLYHFRGMIKDNVWKLSNSLQQQHVNVLLEYIDEAFGDEYADADALFAKGLVSKKHLSKLFGPDEIVVTIKEGHLVAYLSDGLPDASKSSIKLSCSSWTFDGVFHKKDTTFRVDWPSFDPDPRVLPISKLEMFPLKYDTSGAEEMLSSRGKRLWSCRRRRYMSYNAPEFEDMNSVPTVHPRYMIDMDMYHRMNPDESESQPKEGDLTPQIMESDEAPEGSFVFLLPATIVGYCLQDKKWRDLHIEHTHEIVWNVEAFDRLVLKATKKELVKALVTVHVATSASTDVIEGKGNGLIMLLHGGPGTGKTLTAESVAELTSKPLYRVTCGDIGTNPEDVEKYLESVLLVGRIWGCVVLLDEADVFLEERSQTDLQRNALVSVFLRVLEYYDGILILTTNRVGIFDEAFKSRIQLAIHYPDLDQNGRWEIWSNFINSLDREKAKVDDLRKRVDLLCRSKLNGRQIRNTVKTAMQLAYFREEMLDYTHFERVLEVADEFEKYINDTHGGYTGDEFAKSQNLRA